MTHHTDTELKPCPFCGSKAYFEIDDAQWQWVECGGCGMQGNRSASLMEDCKPKLAEAWNSRAPAAPVLLGWKPVPVELLERIQESLGSFVSDHGWSQSDMDTADALDGLLAAAPQPPEAGPSSVSNGSWPDASPQENIREGATYSDPEFEKLAREHAVWGTAQSALCAQFWLAALAQRVPLSDRKIRQIDAHSGLDAIEFARAIERAHGITQEKQG